LINTNDNNTALSDLFNTLTAAGIVDNIKEFNSDWLHRSEGYLRYLRHNNKQASVSALAICSSKLKHYSKLMRQQKKPTLTKLAAEFEDNARKFDNMIMQQSENKWIKQISKQHSDTIH
jgi:hypothetical protein